MKTSLPFLRPAACKTAVIAFIALAPIAASAESNLLPFFPSTVSTIPGNGDVNPYGIAIAPKTLPAAGGVLQPGDILVSNFNNNQNLQGVGTTITRVDKNGNTSTFYTSSKTGLTAAIGILSSGFVFIGNLPTLDGTSATVQPGQLSVLDRNGNFLGTFGTISTINGPWGMAVDDRGNGVSGTAYVFVSNVLSGVISRFNVTYSPTNISATVTIVATGFSHRTDPAAIVLGPSGLAYEASNDTLYVASSADNAIYKIPTATTTNSTVGAEQFINDLTHLHGPLDLVLLPTGHLLVANSDGSNVDPNQPSELVEYNATGTFETQMSIDPNNGGAFGVAAANVGWGTVRFMAVDDNANQLKIWTAVPH